jgi:TPR repeat protein
VELVVLIELALNILIWRNIMPHSELSGEDAYKLAIQQINKSNVLAHLFFEHASEKGHVTAQYELANMYLYGIYVEQDFTKALQWYEKSAEQGNRYAINNLALMHFYGLGVNPSVTNAQLYFEIIDQYSLPHASLEQVLEFLKTQQAKVQPYNGNRMPNSSLPSSFLDKACNECDCAETALTLPAIQDDGLTAENAEENSENSFTSPLLSHTILLTKDKHENDDAKKSNYANNISFFIKPEPLEADYAKENKEINKNQLYKNWGPL